jgi:hypothetical protein
MPKEFRTVLSREKIINRQRVNIPGGLKTILQRLKEIVHVGELLYKRKAIEDKTNFISRSRDILNECAAELKQLQ